MTEAYKEHPHTFHFRDGVLNYTFYVNGENVQKMSKRKREQFVWELRQKLLAALSTLPKSSRTHFCRFGARLLDFATKGVLEDVACKLGFEPESGFD